MLIIIFQYKKKINIININNNNKYIIVAHRNIILLFQLNNILNYINNTLSEIKIYIPKSSDFDKIIKIYEHKKPF